MLDERILRAKRAALEQAATDSELGWLVLAKKGLCDASQFVARIRLRTELGLPRRGCVLDAEECGCLGEALDEALESGGRVSAGEVLEAARRAHGERLAQRPAALSPVPEPPAAVAEPAAEGVSEPAPAAIAAKEPDKAHRFYRRSPKWWDDPPGILNRRF
jgi:hypothetical protein